MTEELSPMTEAVASMMDLNRNIFITLYLSTI